MPLAHPAKYRRTATSVVAGNFDPKHFELVCAGWWLFPQATDPDPPVVPKHNKENENQEQRTRTMKKSKGKQPAREKSKKPDRERPQTPSLLPPPPPKLLPRVPTPTALPLPPPPSISVSGLYQTRPRFEMNTSQRARSYSPPPHELDQLLERVPLPSPEPSATPGPSTSRSSTKRPRTPAVGDDDDDNSLRATSIASDVTGADGEHGRKRTRNRPPPCRKGWKGWLELADGTDVPIPAKAISSENVEVFTERRTRSGKSFDAIGIGQESWVSVGSRSSRTQSPTPASVPSSSPAPTDDFKVETAG